MKYLQIFVGRQFSLKKKFDLEEKKKNNFPNIQQKNIHREKKIKRII